MLRDRDSMTRSILALLASLAAFSGFPDAYPPELEAPPGYLLQAPGLRELGPADLALRPGTFPFPVGERLVYQVRYFGAPVGLASLEVARLVELDGRRYAHLVATARTNEFWTALFRVDDRSEAFVDLASGRVERSRTRTLHGRKEAREEIRYDWATHFVHVRKVKVQKAEIRDTAFDFGPFVHDVFDAFYALRRVPFREGLEIELPVYASRKIHGFRVRAAGAREVAVAALGVAPVPTLELAPYDTIDGEPHAVGNGRVYVLAGESRVPVRLDGWFRFADFIRIGGVSAELVEWQRGRGEWPAAPAAPWSQPPLAPSSVEGRPRWDPPAAVAAARERAGTREHEHKLRLEGPQVSAAP
jgi:hypothetical protein